LLDCYSMREVVKSDDFSDVNVAIIGDIAHSRCARSDTAAVTALGGQVTLIGPPQLLPDNVNGWSNNDSRVSLTDDISAVAGADFVYMLRMQYERQDNHFDSTNYLFDYGMTTDRVKTLKPNALVAHHGPMNRGIEISDDVANQFQDFITRHVTNGVTTRMAVLSLLLGEWND
jgi:aspartate carbamoyltransferase catalytic subunit